MPTATDLARRAQLRRQWQACLVRVRTLVAELAQARIRLALAEKAYCAAHAMVAPTPPAGAVRGPQRQMPKPNVPSYPGA